MTVTVRHIKRMVADFYGVPLAHLNSRRRPKYLARARQMAMYLAREMTPLSYPQIACEFDRDHTTVMYACHCIEASWSANRTTALVIDELKSRLNASQSD